MRWSLPLGRWFGIEVRLHLTFLLLLAFVGGTSWVESGEVGRAARSVAFYVVLFGCVLLHEFGHALAARRYGIRTRDITLLPIGGVARLESTGETPGQELVIALAGPLVNVIIAGGLALGGMTGALRWPELAAQAFEGSLPGQVLAANLFLAVFNLLPAFPMDGGRVLRALLSMRIPAVRATRIAAGVGQVLAAALALAGLTFLHNPMLVFIAFFVWMGASGETAVVEQRSLFAQVPVRAAMLTDFRAISPEDSLGGVAQWLLAGSQTDFPVVVGGEVVGLLTREGLVRGLAAEGTGARAGQFLTREHLTAGPDESLARVVERLQGQDGVATTVPILRDGELVGLLTAENVGEFLMVSRALSGPRSRRG
ncbi:MAG: site-2 protease family protein [Verrucomicrobiota bacterium]